MLCMRWCGVQLRERLLTERRQGWLSAVMFAAITVPWGLALRHHQLVLLNNRAASCIQRCWYALQCRCGVRRREPSTVILLAAAMYSCRRYVGMVTGDGYVARL